MESDLETFTRNLFDLLEEDGETYFKDWIYKTGKISPEDKEKVISEFDFKEFLNEVEQDETISYSRIVFIFIPMPYPIK